MIVATHVLTGQVDTPIRVTVHCATWEYAALLELLDGVEPGNSEEADVLRELVRGLPRGVASERVPRPPR